MHVAVSLTAPMRALVVALLVTSALTGCESMGSFGKKIDYQSTASAPALEVPPDLTTPQFDERYNATTASALAARDPSRPAPNQEIAPKVNADARIVRAGTERWIIAKTTPEVAMNVVRQFWQENGFAIAIDQPQIGVLETDWAENRADIPNDFLRRNIGKLADVLYNTYKRDKFRTRIERGTE